MLYKESPIWLLLLLFYPSLAALSSKNTLHFNGTALWCVSLLSVNSQCIGVLPLHAMHWRHWRHCSAGRTDTVCCLVNQCRGEEVQWMFAAVRFSGQHWAAGAGGAGVGMLAPADASSFPNWVILVIPTSFIIIIGSISFCPGNILLGPWILELL